MNIYKNYYKILNINFDSTQEEIKKSYYKLSFKHHPDKNGDPEIFSEITEAYDILMDIESKFKYDKKSKFGKNYNEFEEFFNISQEIDLSSHKENYNTFKKNDVLDIIVKLDDTFDGSIVYERMIICKKCDGTGKDFLSKIVIKDENGNVKKIFDSDDGCDFCEGSGKNYLGQDCNFCSGKGKIGTIDCSDCKGNKRILGNQKLSNIKLDLNSDKTIVPHMGNLSKYERGKCGNLILIHHIL